MNIKKKLGYFISICCMSGLCLLPAASVSAKETEQTVSANSQEITVSADTVEISDTTDLDADATIVHSGKDGALDWSIDSSGLLTISGTGNYTGKQFEVGSGSNTYKMTYPQWYEYKETIKSAVVKVSGITKTSKMFYDCSNMVSINVSEFDTSEVTYMSSMFEGCSSLSSLDVSGFDTSQVTNMGYMFSGCSRLSSLDVSGFDTSKVTSMGSMFYGCSKLSSLDVSGFDTSEVTYMSSMFSGCSSLSSLDVSGFDTSRVTSMSSMFSGCSSLSSLNVSGFKTSKVAYMSSMFSGCSRLSSLDVSGFDTSQVTYMYSMFSGCSSLSSLDVSGFDTSQVTRMDFMFSGCSSLSSLDVSAFNTSQVTNMYLMFSGCSSLTDLDVSGFETSQVTYINGMFSGCRSLSRLDVSSFDTSKVTDMRSMFWGCSGLTSLDVSGFDTRKVTDMKSMLFDCIKLEKLAVFANAKSDLDLPSVTDCNWYDPSGNICIVVKQGVNTPVTYIRRKTLKASNTVISDIKAVSYTGSEIKPAITVSCGEEKLKEGTDYTVSYQNHVKAGTATLTINGKGYYMGSLQKTFTISPRQLGTGTNITLSAVGYYTGQKLQPTAVVTCNGRTLQANTDYTVSYENNVNPGTASVVITGKGNYAGTVRKPFVIKCHLNKSKIDTLEFTYAAGNMKKLNSKMYFSLYMDFVPVQYATSYEIELSDEKGKVIKTYTVNCNNTDFVEKTFKKLPKDVYGVRIRGCRDGEYGEWSDRSIVVKQPKMQARNYKGAIQIKWQKLKGVSGYDIYMSRKQNSGYKKVASVNAKTTLKTIKKIGKKKLKKGTYYYYVVAKKKLGKKTFKSGINFKSYVKKR